MGLSRLLIHADDGKIGLQEIEESVRLLPLFLPHSKGYSTQKGELIIVTSQTGSVFTGRCGPPTATNDLSPTAGYQPYYGDNMDQQFYHSMLFASI